MSNIKLFESKKIRSAWNDEEEKWYVFTEFEKLNDEDPAI